MKLIIPMAGLGKRMRPLTLKTPKPLLKVAGKSIVHRIIEDLKNSSGKSIDEVHFVIGNFGKEVENNLLELAGLIDAKGFIHYQEDALGTAHAVFCAAGALEGEVVIAFADTLYYGDLHIEADDEAIIWTYEVKNPENYGVVTINDSNLVTGFVEKPAEFVSDKAIVGMYYFREGIELHKRIKYLMDNEITVGGEYQLTDALQDCLSDGIKYACKTLNDWLDFGNPKEYLKSSKKVLGLLSSVNTEKIVDSKIVEPVYFGKNVSIINSTIGPNVILEDHCTVENSEILDTVVGSYTTLKDTKLKASLIGESNNLNKISGKLIVGDFNELEGK